MPQDLPPGNRCSFIRKDGSRCRSHASRYHNPDKALCPVHGARLPPVVKAAARRKALWEALQLVKDGGGRPVWEILIDMTQTSDIIATSQRDELIAAKDTASPEQLAALIDSIEKAARLSKMAIDGRAAELMATKVTTDGEAMVAVFNRAISLSDLDPNTEDRIRINLQRAFREAGGDPNPTRDVPQAIAAIQATVTTPVPPPMPADLAGTPTAYARWKFRKAARDAAFRDARDPGGTHLHDGA